jgi:SAM-dependent methyltransferase
VVLKVEKIEKETVDTTTTANAEVDSYASIAYYYDLEYQNITDDIEFYTEMARQVGANPRILELACGSGRLVLPLARQGLRVTGLDYSEAMLGVARQRLAQETKALQSRVRLQQADMRNFELGEQFDLIFVALNSFQHLLTQADQLASLQAIRKHLAPAGLFIVDVYNPEEKESYPADGRLEYNGSFTNPANGGTVQVFLSCTATPTEQLRHYTYFYDETGPDGSLRRTVTQLDLRYSYRFELELLLDKAGFAVTEFYGSYDFDEYGAGSHKLLYVCRKA